MLSGYMGDVDIRNGGFFWSMDSADDDYASVIEVVVASDMGGPDNVFHIEIGNVYMPADKLAMVLNSCGVEFSDPITPRDKVDAFKAYYGIERDSSVVVQIGGDDPFYDDGRGYEKPTIDRYLGANTKLRGFVLANYVTFEVQE